MLSKACVEALLELLEKECEQYGREGGPHDPEYLCVQMVLSRDCDFLPMVSIGALSERDDIVICAEVQLNALREELQKEQLH